MLLQLGSIKLDVYYNEFPNYRKVPYVVKFSHHRVEDGGLWLQVSLGAILIIFVAILLLCIVKSRKALKKPLFSDESRNKDQATVGQAEADDLFINMHVPSRLQQVAGFTH